MANVLAIAERRGGSLRKISQEVVSAARALAESLGGETHALVFGSPGSANEAASLAAFGADRILVAEHDAFAEYAAEPIAETVAEQTRTGAYAAVVFGASAFGKDLAPRVAARLDVPLAADVTDLAVEGDEIVITRPVYGGRAFAQLTIEASPRVVSIRPNVFRVRQTDGAGAVESIEPAGDPSQARARVTETKAASGEKLDVGEAPIVVSGGRGMKGPENWHLLEALRDALGSRCALGASRAVVDAGWRPHAEQVGQTGKTVAPQLYIAVAISGAMQHLAGMRSAGTIVAINKDPDAPIFKVADFGLVGDVQEILPALTEEIRRATS